MNSRAFAPPPAFTIQHVFQQRAGRVIALSRALLASFFTLAIALESGQPGTQVEAALLLLSAYTLFSGLIFGLTWNNWWLEARLAVPAHAVDLLVFTILVSLTEGYVSPFFTFFVFLVLSSTIRGGWREALLTTGIVIGLFLAAAGLMTWESGGLQGFEVQRFVVRGAHLLVVSFMIVWFGISQLGSRQSRLPMALDDIGSGTGPPIGKALEHAAQRLNAGRVMLVWSEAEEPWLHVHTLERRVAAHERFGPGAFSDLVDATLADRAFLFDMQRRHGLFLRGGRGQTFANRAAIDPAFSARFGIDMGMTIPIGASSGDGHLFALSIPGVSSDDLRLAATVGEEISAAFERAFLLAATHEAATTRARLGLARDLHDSVVQFLAGVGLKLESVKNASNSPLLVTREIDEMQHQLIEEQRDLRRLIGMLKDTGLSEKRAGLADALLVVRARLEQQWEIAFEFDLDASLSDVPVRLYHDIEQLVREAAANAARHGRAKRVSIAAAAMDGVLRLDIGDDGAGFPVDGDFTDDDLRDGPFGPRSLYERVHMLHGAMRLTSSAQTGSRLSIILPLEGAIP